MLEARHPSWAVLAAALLAVVSAVPAFAAGGDGAISGGGGPNSRAERMSQERSWVAPGPLRFGAVPHAQVQEAAAAAAARAGCAISAADAANLTLSPTWPEVAPSGEAPSPMTLSRYDDQASLSDPKQRSAGLYFSPAVGAWQLDSAGLGADTTAAEAIDIGAAAGEVAPYVVGRYCAAINAGAAPERARANAWRAWHACDSGACEDVFQRLRAGGITEDESVGPLGGAEPRVCVFEGVAHDCLRVDPRAAQGETSWTAPRYGPAPVPAPFYVFTYREGGRDYEVRYWPGADSGARGDVSVSRELGVNARDRLSWSAEPGLCDATSGRGCRT